MRILSPQISTSESLILSKPYKFEEYLTNRARGDHRAHPGSRKVGEQDDTTKCSEQVGRRHDTKIAKYRMDGRR